MVTNAKSKSPLKLSRKSSLYRPMSLAVGLNNGSERVPTGFSGQLTKEGPILTRVSINDYFIYCHELPNYRILKALGCHGYNNLW